MTLPEKVIIGTVIYKVIMDQQEWINLEHRLQKKDFYGHAIHMDATIYLNPALSETVIPLTLWHEILHALCESVMGSPDWQFIPELSKEDREEAVIRAFEHSTLAVLVDNPELVDYLVKRSQQ